MNRRQNTPPKKHVLSFRVSEAEWQKLQAASAEAGADVSSLLRQSLRQLLTVQQG
jgi:hypothetical protein